MHYKSLLMLVLLIVADSVMADLSGKVNINAVIKPIQMDTLLVASACDPSSSDIGRAFYHLTLLISDRSAGNQEETLKSISGHISYTASTATRMMLSEREPRCPVWERNLSNQLNWVEENGYPKMKPYNEMMPKNIVVALKAYSQVLASWIACSADDLTGSLKNEELIAADLNGRYVLAAQSVRTDMIRLAHLIAMSGYSLVESTMLIRSGKSKGLSCKEIKEHLVRVRADLDASIVK